MGHEALSAIVVLSATVASAQSPVDPALADFIATIKAVDNHTHVNSTAPGDPDSDALPLDGLPAFLFPARLRPENPEWLAGYKALYGYEHADLTEPHRAELRATMARVAKEQGDRFPEWALDKIGTEVMVANRVAMGPGLAPPRFRWASYVDALMLPLSTEAERATNGDSAVLYPLEEALLRRYLKDLGIAALPPTLDAYRSAVVVPTLEGQRKAGCIAVKFEAAYLRKLDFDDPDPAAARAVYARYVAGGTPTHAEYKVLEDYLFREIAREAGRLGMAVHVHSFEGAGGFYRIGGSDPLLLEPALNDRTLRGTNFVIIHGGGIYASHTAAMFAKPNVYADFSVMPQFYSAALVAGILREWLTQYPEKVLFGTDAFSNGADSGWELSAWLASKTARQALAIALTGMMRDGEITRTRAEEIATMALRSNASALYKLGLR
jgi:uncharacterized protein